MRRLPPKSRRCLAGWPDPSPEERATAPVPHRRAELGFAGTGEPKRVTYFTKEWRGGDWSDAVFATQIGAVLIEQGIDDPFKPACFASHGAVVFDEWGQPRQPIVTGTVSMIRLIVSRDTFWS